MRADARSVALVALGMWTSACAVYQADQIPLDGDGAPLAGTGGSAGQSNPSGGSPSTGGKGGSGATLGGSGGVPPAPEEHGGESAGGAAEDGGESSGGSASGGVAGAGGSGGTTGGSGASGSSGAGGGGGVSGGGAGGSGNAGASGSAGNGGSGGGVSTPSCEDHPLSASATWTASASHDNGGTSPASNVLDGKQTRWTTGKAQSGDEWLQIDFGRVVTLSHVNLQQGNVDTNDYPRSYVVIVSDTTKDLNGTPRATGMGKTGVSTPILLPKLATGRYLLIKQVGSSLSWWSTQEVEVSCSD